MTSEADNFVDKLLDENNIENLFLYDENDKLTEFKQVAIIPLDDGDGGQTVYCILKPADKMPGVAEDEALVFELREIDDEDALVLVDDEKIVNAVFAEYYDLIDAESGDDE